MAPERLFRVNNTLSIGSPSNESDIYSLAMVSFEVCFGAVNHPTIDPIVHYDQVLTGILPYDGSDRDETANRIGSGERPARPGNQSQNQWLQDRIWDVITTGWNHKPKRRCALSIMHHIFLHPSQQEVQDVKSGN